MNTEEPLVSASFIAVINTLGHAVLIETIRMAAYYVNHSNGTSILGHGKLGRIEEARSCYAYVQGTGLDIIMNRFGISYNSDKIRDTFNYCIRHSA